MFFVISKHFIFKIFQQDFFVIKFWIANKKLKFCSKRMKFLINFNLF
jgi:hypothetical protein